MHKACSILTSMTCLRKDCQEVQKAGQGALSILADVLHQPGNTPAWGPLVCRHVSNKRCNCQAQLRPDRLRRCMQEQQIQQGVPQTLCCTPRKLLKVPLYLHDPLSTAVRRRPRIVTELKEPCNILLDAANVYSISMRIDPVMQRDC